MGINSAIKIKYIKFISACVTSLLISISLYGQNDVTNVIIIISDDLNDSVEGMGGHAQAQTPNIDRLIDMGVQFTNAHANAPICGPSRASLWTGMYPSKTGRKNMPNFLILKKTGLVIKIIYKFYILFIYMLIQKKQLLKIKF